MISFSEASVWASQLPEMVEPYCMRDATAYDLILEGLQRVLFRYTKVVEEESCDYQGQNGSRGYGVQQGQFLRSSLIMEFLQPVADAMDRLDFCISMKRL